MALLVDKSLLLIRAVHIFIVDRVVAGMALVVDKVVAGMAPVVDRVVVGMALAAGTEVGLGKDKVAVVQQVVADRVL